MKKWINISLLKLIITCLSGCNYSKERKVINYMKDNNNVDVIVSKFPTANSGNVGDTAYLLQEKRKSFY